MQTQTVIAMRLRRIANILTIVRALLAVPILIALNYGYLSVAFIILLVGALTDLIDGRLARKAGGGTSWGAKVDPLTDKILLLAPLVWLVNQQILPVWAIWILVSRELIISSWRSNKVGGVPANYAGKIKTLMQLLSTLLMLWPPNWYFIIAGNNINKLGWYLFWPALLLTLVSAISYLKTSLKYHHD